MRLSVKPFRLPKAGSSLAEYEDACHPARAGRRGGSRVRLAIADGATEGVGSGVWADILAQTYSTSRARQVSVQHLSRTARRRWRRWRARYIAEAEARGGLPWFVEDGLQRGAFAAMAGITLADEGRDDGTWRSLAVGDSCLFQVRDEELLVAFPIADPAVFDNRPLLLGSIQGADGRHPGLARTTGGCWRAGDEFYLMTDALAAWFLQEHASGAQPWRQLKALDAGAAFRRWIDSLRQARQLRNDDVTLLQIMMD